MDAYRAKAGGNWPFDAPLSWTTNYGNTTTISSSSVVTATTDANNNGVGYFSGSLPAESCYLDVTLDSGYSDSPTSVAFMGVSNVVSQFNYGAEANYKAWYWSGSWWGNGTNYVTPPTSLVADTYRIAVNRSNGRLYIKRSGNATVASADLPSGSTLYLMVLPQNSYRTPGATIVNGRVYSGSGGLY